MPCQFRALYKLLLLLLIVVVDYGWQFYTHVSVQVYLAPLGDAIPTDAEVSPELLAALTSQQLKPEDIEIVTDADGKSVIRLISQVKLNKLILMPDILY